MSLTSELADPRSILTRWCAERFRRTPAVVDQVAAAVRDVRPVRPKAREVTGRHWAEIGGAWGQRLAELVQPAPPYYALLGMLRAQWVSWAWAHRQAAQYPTHQQLPEQYLTRALALRPAVTTWLDLDYLSTDDGTTGSAAAEDAWGELLARTRAYLAQHAPPGRLGSAGAEAGLARSCWLLSACEDLYRSGAVDERLDRLVAGGARPSVAQLRGLPGEDQVAELVELAGQLHSTGALWELRKLAGSPGDGQPLGIASPTIVPQWADADLLLGPDPAADDQGTTLIDVKTVVSVRDTGKVGRWLWQALLYAWLDTADLYRIRRVGLLLARHGVLITWPVDELTEQLLGRRDAGDRDKDQAVAIAGRIITGHGLRFPVV